MNHVIFATAITLAYSSIEELQLEPKWLEREPEPQNLMERGIPKIWRSWLCD
jgi:hypothetical protein